MDNIKMLFTVLIKKEIFEILNQFVFKSFYYPNREIIKNYI